jgi:nicotinamidase-related amidase
MPETELLTLHLRRQRMERDRSGRAVWVPSPETRSVDARATALLLCDVWDRHWCRGANERLAEMLPRMAATVSAARSRGVQIIHAPSDTMPFYRDAPARRRIASLPILPAPEELPHDDPVLPLDDSDGGGDTADDPGGTDQQLWSRQHPAIEIDQERDVISDDGREILAFMAARSISHLVIMGVHTNMCILDRSFGIKQMVRWGVDIMLCRDLTDSMYNPARPPYASHAEGTALVVAYIEKFWCPTLTSDDLLSGASRG